MDTFPKNRVLSLGFFVLLLQSLAGCQSQNALSDSFESDLANLEAALRKSAEMNHAASVSKGESGSHSANPTSADSAVDRGRSDSAQVSSKTLPHFDVAADDTPLDQFMTGLVADSPFNIVVHPEVKGSVSLKLSDVSVVDVLEVLRDVYDLHLTVTGNLVQIMPNVMQTEVFTLDYVSVMRQGVSDMRVSTGSIRDAGAGSQGQNADNGESTNTGAQSSEVVGSRVTTENSVDMWSNLRAAIESLIGSGEDRQVIVLDQAGVIVVKALRTELAAVASFLKTSELALQRQVILEAKILEVVLSDRYSRGVNWKALDTIGGLKGGDASMGISGAGVVNPDGIDGVFTTALGLQDFSGIISLLESQGEVKVLSSPRIATVNNQKAVIKVGTDEFFVTNVTSTTTTGTSTTTTPSVTLTPFFSGIALDVTPQISADGDVILHIHPTVSQVSDQNKVVTIGNDVVNLPLALSTIRESDSIVRAKNEQVIVIGGLMQNTSTERTAGLPGANRVPLFGKGVGQKRREIEKSELVILVRPIVADPGEMEVDALESLRRIASLEIDRRS